MNRQQQKKNELHRAFYSLVQYCPDLSRLEVANVGVVVFCPELGFLESKLAQNHTRVNQMFGRGQRDLQRLRIVKAGLQKKLEATSAEQMSLEHLNQLAALHVNTIRMSQFMPCRVSSNPQFDLESMFDKLVDTPKKPNSVNKPKALQEALEKQFSLPEIKNRIRRKIKVRIPILDREEEIPYGYQNGRLNLITPVVFPQQNADVETKSAKYAVEGRSLYQNKDSEFGKMQLLIVGQFSDQNPKNVETATRILAKHDVRLFQQGDLQDLVSEIAAQGHIIS